MLFKSSYPDLEIPSHLPVWDYLFNNKKYSFDSNDQPISPPAFINATTKESLTHEEIKAHSIHFSTALGQEFDLQPGDVVSICAGNPIWYPVAMFGLMRAGVIGALSSPGYGEEEMVHAFRTVGCKVIICDAGALATVVKAARKLGIGGERIVVLDTEIEGFRSVMELIAVGERPGEGGRTKAFQIPIGKRNSEFCSLLCFSSGTTGLPKAVMISHQNIIAQCLQLLPTTSPDHRTVLGLLPFYHITGVLKLLAFPLIIAASVVILPSFTMPTLLSTVCSYRIAEVQMVPPLLIRLVRDPIVANYDLSCIRRFASGAAPIAAEVLQLLEEKFPGRGFKQGYGMTESCGCITTHPLDRHGFEYARTGGSLVASTIVKVVDSEGREVGVGERGEILAKGPQMVLGYFNNPAATAAAFDSEGFLRTGDEGSIDSEGMIMIHDRIKEMIKVKGIQVAPAELEDLLLGHEKVEDAAVIGIPDDYSGERPLGFVVLKPGVDRKGIEEELMEYVRKTKVRTKWLVGVRILEQVPKSPSGKILRRVLRDGYRDEQSILKSKL